MHREETVDWHMARSSVYDLLSSLLSERPAAETIHQLTSPQAVELIDVLFGDPGIGPKLDRLADLYRKGRLSTEEVVLDFEGLMRVPGGAYTHPYESSYSNRNRSETREKWAGLCGPQTREVEGFYRDEGLTPRYDQVDFADHIGAELAFMAHLCRKTAEATRSKQVDRADDLLSKQQQFAQNHLMTWAEDFSAQLKARAATPYFQAVAAMLFAFVETEKGQLADH